jgi:hypothetical protein
MGFLGSSYSQDFQKILLGYLNPTLPLRLLKHTEWLFSSALLQGSPSSPLQHLPPQ